MIPLNGFMNNLFLFFIILFFSFLTFHFLTLHYIIRERIVYLAFYEATKSLLLDGGKARWPPYKSAWSGDKEKVC